MSYMNFTSLLGILVIMSKIAWLYYSPHSTRFTLTRILLTRFFLAYVRICVNLIITVITYFYANFVLTRFFSKDQNACKSENRYAWKKGQRLPLHEWILQCNKVSGIYLTKKIFSCASKNERGCDRNLVNIPLIKLFRWMNLLLSASKSSGNLVSIKVI